MDLLKITLGIYFLILPCENVCVIEDCGNIGQKREECSIEEVPEDGRITSVEIIKQDKPDKCIKNGNYGFGNNFIWVSDRCSADFNVCYIVDADEETTKAPVNTVSTKGSTIIHIDPKSAPNEATDRSMVHIPTGTTTIETDGNATRMINDLPHKEYTLAASVIGVVAGGLVFLICMAVIVVLLLKRFQICRPQPRKNTFGSHRNVIFTISEETTVNTGESGNTYNTLDEYFGGNHQYQECSTLPRVPNGQTHAYVTIYDSFPDKKSNVDKDHSYFSLEPEAIKSNENHSQHRNPEERADDDENSTNDDKKYLVLDPSQTGFCKGLPTNCNAGENASTMPVTNTFSNSSYQHDYTIKCSEEATTNQEASTNCSSETNSETTNTQSDIYLPVKDGVYNKSRDKNHVDKSNDINNGYSYASDFTYITANQGGLQRETDENYVYPQNVSAVDKNKIG